LEPLDGLRGDVGTWEVERDKKFTELVMEACEEMGFEVVA